LDSSEHELAPSLRGRAPTPVYDNELKKWIVQEQYNGNEIFEGNLHNFLLRQAGGSAAPKEPEMFTKGPANKRAGTKTGMLCTLPKTLRPLVARLSMPFLDY